MNGGVQSVRGHGRSGANLGANFGSMVLTSSRISMTWTTVLKLSNHPFFPARVWHESCETTG